MGSKTQAMVCLGPAMTSMPASSTADVATMKTAMVLVLSMRWARKGLTTQKHRSLAITTLRNMLTHVKPVRPAARVIG